MEKEKKSSHEMDGIIAASLACGYVQIRRSIKMKQQHGINCVARAHLASSLPLGRTLDGRHTTHPSAAATAAAVAQSKDA